MEKGQSFEEFILGCAKAFGACIMMRDDSLDKPIPEKFEPSDYYVVALDKAIAEFEKLKKMTDKQKAAFGKEQKDAEIKRRLLAIKKNQEENKRLADMESHVKAWIPLCPFGRCA